MKINPTSVVVALSGGVDSAVAAASLKMAGWEVCGLHFLLPAPHTRAKARINRAERLANHLEIPLHVLDLREIFSRQVIDPFVDAYLNGLTPNPCVLCNQLIKFEYLIHYAKQHEIDYIATGHYARVKKGFKNPYCELYRGADRRKEQSYFLHRLNQSFLLRAIFPLGESKKDEVRKHALETGLPVNNIVESQEICFIPENDYRSFVEKKKGHDVNKPGNITDSDGQIRGQHTGTFRYTIGQRQGLGIASSRPWYVKEIRPQTNEVVIARKDALYSTRVEAEEFNWIREVPPSKVMKAQAQIRYRHKPALGQLEVISSDKVKFIFDEPQWAITPGQALVCYEGERVLGGGWVRKA
ncbi:MAG: tRNA 2-thiouridine(34) synthase MnmA [Desulfobacteraceae bacterium]|nr:MAG: tRNA 2-thiouridine(34) synthase MnmA [Desulfobacteraceae bacterium]